MDNGSNVNKINIRTTDELTDIVSKISESQSENILLSFAEHSDLLVSPVNIKVLLETADQEERALIFQVPDQPAAVRNIAETGAVYTDKTGEVSNDLWQQAYTEMKNRRKNITSALRRTTSAGITKEIENDETPGESAPEQISTKELEVPASEDSPKSEFKERIDRALQKSREDIETGKLKTVEEGGLAIALGHDIKKDQASGNMDIVDNSGTSPLASFNEKERNLSLTGRDLLAQAPKPTPQPTATEQIKDPSSAKKDGVATVQAKVAAVGVSVKKLIQNKKFKKVGILAVLPLLLLILLIAYGYYWYTPLVRVNLYIESRPVEVEREFRGTPDVDQFDIENSQIPVKRESISKERSDSTNATGTGSRGEYSTGIVRFNCGPIDGATVSKLISSGTTLTSADGLTYKLTQDVTFNCPVTDSFPTGTAQAAEFGAEYNISSGVILSVPNEPDIVAVTDSPFTGGMEEEYTVISQEDFKRVVDPLRDTAYDESENELRGLEQDGWVIIEDSIKHELDGEVQTDFPVGAEAEILNVTVKTKSSALYFRESELDEIEREILLDAAQEQNLFESDNDLQLQLGEDIQTEIEFKEVKDNSVTMIVKISGSVKPDVEKSALENELQGKGWEEGLNYLSNLDFVARDTEVTFEPENFPERFKYFPRRQGRLLINIREVEVEPEESGEAADDGATDGNGN